MRFSLFLFFALLASSSRAYAEITTAAQIDEAYAKYFGSGEPAGSQAPATDVVRGADGTFEAGTPVGRIYGADGLKRGNLEAVPAAGGQVFVEKDAEGKAKYIYKSRPYQPSTMDRYAVGKDAKEVKYDGYSVEQSARGGTRSAVEYDANGIPRGRTVFRPAAN